MPGEINQFHISTGTMIRFFAIVFGLMLLYVVRDIVIALLFAIIVASAVEPAVSWLKRRYIPRILSGIMIYVAVVFFVFFILYLVIPVIADEMQGLATTLPGLREQIRSGFERVDALPFVSFLIENVEDILQIPARYTNAVGGGLLNLATSVFGGFFSLILIVVFSFYLIAQEKGIENFLRLMTPIQHEPYVIDLWERSQRKLGKWLRAQLLLGAIVGVLIFFGLTFLGMKQAILFAILAALFEIIPVVGPILAAVPPVAIAFLTDPTLAIFIIILYIAVQQVESHVIIPVVMRQSIGLSPLIVVIALLVGAKLGGIFGILLAVPLTAILAEFINDWDKKKRAIMPEYH